jgi:hypothetical protein
MNFWLQNLILLLIAGVFYVLSKILPNSLKIPELNVRNMCRSASWLFLIGLIVTLMFKFLGL